MSKSIVGAILVKQQLNAAIQLHVSSSAMLYSFHEVLIVTEILRITVGERKI